MINLFTFLTGFFCGSVKKDLAACQEENIALSEKYDVVVEKSVVLTKANDVLKAAVESWKREADNYRLQLQALQDVALVIPDISAYLVGGVPYDPYAIIHTPDYDYVLAADSKYYTYTYEQWVNMFDLIQPLVEDKWVSDVFDCDDFAELIHAFTCLGFKNANLTRQGMFAIAWSYSHAYNLFMTQDMEWYIYEPQTNQVIGKLGDVEDSNYNTRIILFTH